MAAQPNSSARLTAATYILHCSNVCASVSSVSSSRPHRNFIPFLTSQFSTSRASSSLTRCIAAYSHPRPRPAPIGHRQNRPWVRKQARQKVLAVLPYALRHNQRRFGIQPAKDLHPHLLRINETVLLPLVIRMRPNRRPPLSLESLRQNRFHLRLLRPAFLIGGKPQIAVGHQVSLPALKRSDRFHG